MVTEDWPKLMNRARAQARLTEQRARVEAMECNERMRRVLGTKWIYVLMTPLDRGGSRFEAAGGEGR